MKVPVMSRRRCTHRAVLLAACLSLPITVWAAPPSSDQQAELTVTVSNESPVALSGDWLTYTIEVANRGPEDVPEAWVSTDPVQGLGEFSYSCLASPGASCRAEGLGAPNDLVRLPAGATVTYVMSAKVTASAGQLLSNRVTVEPMRPYHDFDVSNNEAIQQDLVASAASEAGAE